MGLVKELLFLLLTEVCHWQRNRHVLAACGSVLPYSEKLCHSSVLTMRSKRTKKVTTLSLSLSLTVAIDSLTDNDGWLWWPYFQTQQYFGTGLVTFELMTGKVKQHNPTPHISTVLTSGSFWGVNAARRATQSNGPWIFFFSFFFFRFFVNKPHYIKKRKKKKKRVAARTHPQACVGGLQCWATPLCFLSAWSYRHLNYFRVSL